MEGSFGEITDKPIRREVFGSVADLIAALAKYLAANNTQPKPFVWTATRLIQKFPNPRILARQARFPVPG